MVKRQTGWTEEKIAKYYKEGRGQGELVSYKPWLTIQDVPSRGRVHRSIGWKTGREHHFLSDKEYNYFCILDWANDVVDIREQFPLHREDTVSIAEELGVHHSVDLNSNIPIVMTTDFLVTVREGDTLINKARTIKLKKDLNDKRVIEKFEIERAYWEKYKVDWAIVTEEEMPKELVENLKFLKQSFWLQESEQEYFTLFIDEWNNFEGSIISNLKIFENKYNLEQGTAITLFKYAIANKFLICNLSNKLELVADVNIITSKREIKR